MSGKQKIAHSRGPFNIILVIFVCSFEVCRVYNHFLILTMLTVSTLYTIKIFFYNFICLFGDWYCACAFAYGVSDNQPLKPVTCYLGSFLHFFLAQDEIQTSYVQLQPDRKTDHDQEKGSKLHCREHLP